MIQIFFLLLSALTLRASNLYYSPTYQSLPNADDILFSSSELAGAHRQKMGKLSDILITTKSMGSAEMSHRRSIVLKRTPGESHCVRPHGYKAGSLMLDVSNMRAVLNIERIYGDRRKRKMVYAERIGDEGFIIPASLGDYLDKVSYENLEGSKTRFLGSSEGIAVVDVQAMISMDELVDALLPLNLLPLVVPEFKGITVGGSIQGLAGESSSFIFGLFHHAVVGFEVLLSNGSVIWCSQNSHPDLFYGLPGSFGSLGICTRAKILCMPASRRVKVTCRAHDTAASCYEHMRELQRQTLSMGSSEHLRFLEGIGYSQRKFVSIRGSFLPQQSQEESVTWTSSSRWGCKWFFNIVKDRCKQLFKSGPTTLSGHTSAEVSFVMDSKDYLFRHDHGSFWMASYRIPQIIGRFLGSMLDSSSMFKLASALPWMFPKEQIVLQDFMLPYHNAHTFLQSMQAILSSGGGGKEEAVHEEGAGRISEKSGIWPVWLLPMRGCDSILPPLKQRAHSPAIFSLRDLDPKRQQAGSSPHYCNAGAYGIPSLLRGRGGRYYDFIPCNKKLETLLHRCGGRKVLYSHAFYERSFFYGSLYDGEIYFQLRRKYCADEALPEIFDKVVTKNGKL